MKPFDPRLLRSARASRWVLGAGAALGLVRAVAITAWCWCLAQALAIAVLPVLGGEPAGRPLEYAAPASALPQIIAVGLTALVVRSAAGWGMDIVASRGAALVKTQLREAALDALDARSPLRAGGRPDAELATVLGRGLDALDGYFSGYVPQLILTAVSTPVLVLGVLLADPVSGAIVIAVFPIIPVFMILIGLATQAVQDRQWRQLQRLSSSFMDAVSGVPTLKLYRREGRQSSRIARETEEYRSRTMQVLRVTFLSGFVLDLAGTFSIALVAVTVGTRLVDGAFPIALGLFVLLLLPETFIPIRQVGAAYHSSAEGLAASADVFSIIDGDGEAEPAVRTAGLAPTAAVVEAGAGRAALRIDRLEIRRGDRRIGPVSLAVEPGSVVALAGPSGAGKSSIVAALLGFVPPASGSISRSVELAWCGQRPGLLQGSLAQNIAIGDAAPDRARAARALARVGLEGLGIDHELGAGGSGVSGGQAQRVAIARALYRADSRPGAALVLDEPTSALDAESEARIIRVVREAAELERRPVLVVSHRPAVLAAADRIVRVGAPCAAAVGLEAEAAR